MDLKKHLLTESHDKKARQSEKTIRDTYYISERRKFTIETYYGIITKAFNDLADVGYVYSLTKEHKVTKFEGVLK